MSRPRAARGFTLLEMVIAIVISGIILVFVAMFIIAPIDAYAAHGERGVLLANASTAWPRMREDLRQALSNSVRWRRNGGYVALELLRTCGYARYSTPPGALFDATGTAAGVFGNCAVFDNVHLAVNNAGQEAYTQTLSMTPPVQLTLIAGATPGEAQVQVVPAPVVNSNSPRSRVYLVEGAVTYLCDEGQGTITRYAGYPIAALQASRDTPAELAGATSSEVVARGISACAFGERIAGNLPQSVAVHLTTTRNAESVHLAYAAAVENLP
jgi:MSHA biogenesis protein MshO